MPTLRLLSILICFAAAASGCKDTESERTFGGVGEGTLLGELDDEASMALCEAVEESYSSTIQDDENKRGACLAQILSDVDIALFNVDNRAGGTREDVIAVCEDALERCMDQGPMYTPCTTLEYAASCKATVGDFAQCLEGGYVALPAFAAADCESYVNDDSENDRLVDAALESLEACPRALLDESCSSESIPEDQDEPWFDVTLRDVDNDADTLSNDEWLVEISTVVENQERADCEAMVEHDAALDGPAGELAAEPVGSGLTPDVDTAAAWKHLTNNNLEAVLERVLAFLNDEGSACTWVRYGVAVDGEPGESRRVVVLLAEVAE